MTPEELAAIRIALSPAADYPFSVHGHVTFGQVRALLAEVDRLRAALKSAKAIVLRAEWGTRHAAENRYCESCADSSNDWTDQNQHHDGCEWVEVNAAIDRALRGEA